MIPHKDRLSGRFDDLFWFKVLQTCEDLLLTKTRQDVSNKKMVVAKPSYRPEIAAIGKWNFELTLAVGSKPTDVAKRFSV